MSSFETEASESQNAQGIEAEIPQARRRQAEELERIARSPQRGDAPNTHSTFFSRGKKTSENLNFQRFTLDFRRHGGF
jgi:hypothetical protein